MRLASPTSRTRFRLRLLPSDFFWAAAAPFIALALRDPTLLELEDFPRSLPAPYQYALVSIVCAIVTFLGFRLSERMSRFFTLRDALIICGAAACAVTSSSFVLFTATRLDGVPRSTPLIYGLVLTAGLIFTRAAARVFYKGIWAEREQPDAEPSTANLRRIVLIGVDRFSAVAIKLTDYQRPRTTQVVAALDARPSYVGRNIGGVQIVGLVQDLGAVIDEYAVHGVAVDQVWLSDDSVPAELVDGIGEQCAARNLPFLRISEAFNLSPPDSASSALSSPVQTSKIIEVTGYFKLKRIIDIVAAGALLIALLPLAACVAGVTLFDVGTPVLFWQQRVGRKGRKFLLYKFRTYHAPFDKTGRRIPEAERLSKIGRAIRTSRLDEIPQLYNVLVGHMSLIGPRPLLPHDQPRDPSLRLGVRPGVTGWAQINGGTIVTPEEKNALDVWYIQHASLWLDLQIAFRTMLVALTGVKMNHSVIDQAMLWRGQNTHFFDPSNNDERTFGRSVSSAARQTDL